jgi:hypothetical protein
MAGVSALKQEVIVQLGSFAYEALAGEAGKDADRVPARVVRAIRSYLHDKESGRPGWPYPAFARENGVGEKVELRLSIDDDLWRSLEAEAEGQGVTVQQMVEHVALYFAAEVNAGRVTQRILDDLGNEGEDGGER